MNFTIMSDRLKKSFNPALQYWVLKAKLTNLQISVNFLLEYIISIYPPNSKFQIDLVKEIRSNIKEKERMAKKRRVSRRF